MGRNVNKQSQICGPDIFNKCIFSVILLHSRITILAVSHIYRRRFRSLNIVQMYDVNNSDLKDPDLAFLNNSYFMFKLFVQALGMLFSLV